MMILARFVSPSGTKQFVSGLKLRSRDLRLVNPPGKERLARWLDWRSRSVKLRAASKPCKLLIFSDRAVRFVRPSKSSSVKGPLGFCKASRMAAFRLGSGIDTSCARADVVALTSTSAVKINGLIKDIAAFIF